MSPVVTREVVDCGDHSEAMLAGLHRLRQAGLLLDTLLWAEGVSFQVSTSNIRQRIIIHDLVHWMTLEDFSKLCVNAKGNLCVIKSIKVKFQKTYITLSIYPNAMNWCNSIYKNL